MLDAFYIFSLDGVVLWHKEFTQMPRSALDSFVTRILAGRSHAPAPAVVHSRLGEWEWASQVNSHTNIVVVAVWNAILPLGYTDTLVRAVAAAWDQVGQEPGWQGTFTEIYHRVEQADEGKTAPTKPKGTTPLKGATKGSASKAATPLANGKGTRAKGTPSGAKGKGTPGKPGKPGKKGKSARTWDDKISVEDAAALDMSGSAGNNSAEDEDAALAAQAAAMAAQRGDGSAPIDLDALIGEAQQSGTDGGADAADGGGAATAVWSFFSKLSGSYAVTAADLEEPMRAFKSHLIGKNVAPDIAQDLCDSVAARLVGEQLGSMGSVSDLIRDALAQAITRILTPNRHIDVLGGVRTKRAANNGAPYVIVFVGVNGVGKSTSLSKVCSLLQLSGFKVMIAACDTFRSGAVEQLQVHARVLKAPVFSEGYNKDAASVAKNAIAEASRDGYDVVLVDTAGRMQTNQPLMQSLAKLVSVNQPDLIMFVGEALVGNEAVDQIQSFSKAMVTYAPDPKKARTVDCVMLTKFDTVDDKVGAAVSMVHCTGLPIAFVGVGQQYADLRRLNVQHVVNALMK